MQSEPTARGRGQSQPAARKAGLLRRLFGLGGEARSLENPATSIADPAMWLLESLGAAPSYSGPTVSEQTAVTLSAVWACVRILSETLGSLPCSIYQRQKRGSREATEHPLYPLLKAAPNPQMSPIVFRETGQAHLALHGNSYSEIVRDGTGRAVELWPMPPQGMSVWRAGGVRRYAFTPPSGGPQIPLDASQVLHVPGLGFDGVKGKAPLRIAKESIGEGLAQQEFAGRFFGNGINAGGVLEHPESLSDNAYARLKRSIQEMQGGLSNAHKPWIIEEGMKWHATTIPPEAAQFLESRKFKTNDIARIFGVPPHLIGDLEKATFSNIEQQGISFVVYCIRPWAVRWEQELERQLLFAEERGEYFIRFNLDGLLRGDSAARGTFYKSLFDIGAITQNEIREREDLPPMPGGDRLYVPLNMIDPTAGEGDVGGAPPAKKPGAGGASPAKRADAVHVNVRQLQPIVDDTVERIRRRELDVLGRAARKPELAGFLEQFFDGHQQYVQRQLEPIAGVCGLDAAAIAAAYVQQCRSQIRAASAAGELAQQIERWSERAGQLALPAPSEEKPDNEDQQQQQHDEH